MPVPSACSGLLNTGQGDRSSSCPILHVSTNTHAAARKLSSWLCRNAELAAKAFLSLMCIRRVTEQGCTRTDHPPGGLAGFLPDSGVRHTMLFWSLCCRCLPRQNKGINEVCTVSYVHLTCVPPNALHQSNTLQPPSRILQDTQCPISRHIYCSEKHTSTASACNQSKSSMLKAGPNHHTQI